MLVLEAIFETERGVYQVDTETGLFTVQGQRSTPKLFLGSLSPDTQLSSRHGTIPLHSASLGFYSNQS